MAKKDKEDQELRLTGEEFWQWKECIARMGKANADHATAQTEIKMLQLEYQNKAMQIQLHNKTRLESTKQAVENSMGEYNTLKGRFEDRLGISLNNKSIDEVTYEVKELPNN